MQASENNEIEVDSHNGRIVGYIREGGKALLDCLENLRQTHGTSKTVVYMTGDSRELFLAEGYCEEGKIDRFFCGEDAYILSKFYDGDRCISIDSDEKDSIIETVSADTKIVPDKASAPEYRIEFAGPQDAEKLSALYRSVFAVYPTNVFDPRYLAEQMGDRYVFVVARNGDEIVSAASAVIKPELRNAEITDCATHPDFRGKQLTSLIIRKLESYLVGREIRCLYSLTRASSIGMNMTVRRLGYKYQGRLVNNCTIYSGLEDMNVWTKNVP